jgi:hypothetical protein
MSLIRNGQPTKRGEKMEGPFVQGEVRMPKWLANLLVGYIVAASVAAFGFAWNANADLALIKFQLTDYRQAIEKFDSRLERLEQTRHRATSRSAGE